MSDREVTTEPTLAKVTTPSKAPPIPPVAPTAAPPRALVNVGGIHDPILSNGYFPFDKDVYNEVRAHGLDYAVGYLIMACGTSGRNKSTSLGAHSIQKYGCMSRGRAAEIMKWLKDAGIATIEHVKSKEGENYDRHVLKRSDAETNLIWLPDTLVTGSSGETSPLAVLRKNRLLGALICMYEFLDLPDSNGVMWSIARRKYKRRLAGRFAGYTVWSFEPADIVMDETFEDAPDLAARIHRLEYAGLICTVPYLIDRDPSDPDAEIIHPCVGEFAELAKQGAGVLLTLAESGVNDYSRLAVGKSTPLLVPVKKGLTRAQIVGVLRPRHLANTEETLAWTTSRSCWDHQKIELAQIVTLQNQVLSFQKVHFEIRGTRYENRDSRLQSGPTGQAGSVNAVDSIDKEELAF
jgi:hypothetical protein